MDARDALGEPAAHISRSALLHNAGVIRRAVGQDVKICAIVKANAYGHDAQLVIDTLANFSADGASDSPPVDAFAVADLDEAAELPPVPQPLLVLRPVENVFLGRQRAKIELAIRQGWLLTVANAAAADDIARIAMAVGKRAHLHVMVDTGMNRAGVGLDQLDSLMHKIDSRPSLRLAGIYTHFVTAEDAEHPLTIEQLAMFLDKTDGIAGQSAGRVIRHAANSGAVFFSSSSHLDMVRPGISLYGVDPTGTPSMDRPLRPALRWTAPLIGIRDVPRGGSVGYNQTWTADRDTRVGLVPVGYADGYQRAFSNRGVMLIHGSSARVIGRVSMDLTTIDLSQVPMACIGDEVTVLDNDPLSGASVYQLAKWADTIPYEIFCRIGPRVRRVAVEPTDGREVSATADDQGKIE
ncbi:MAG TPA: alanine racemase [Tepidisphaeraceae bacterium]|nr:alanine racemase [Tepidisphaeraceae bacterium]